jgi:predicted metal-dependent hydrolase
MKLSTFTYGNFNYQYYLVYQDRKTVSLTVQPSLHIILRCPTWYTSEKVERFLTKKWLWLEAQIRELKRFQRRTIEKEYISGESFLYLGRQYKLVVQEADINQVCFGHGKIILKTTKNKNDKKQNKKLLSAWYEERAEQIFAQRYTHILKKFYYDFVPELTVRKMEKRWGSLLSSRKVLLNPELIKASKQCIDYVITHELCHMKYRNHNREFYKLLESKILDWKQVKEKLELRFL